MVPGQFCEVDFEIDESFIASLEEIFDVLVLFDEQFKLFDCVIDLMFIELYEGDGFFFLLEMQFGLFGDVLVMGQVFLELFFVLGFFFDRFLLVLRLGFFLFLLGFF